MKKIIILLVASTIGFAQKPIFATAKTKAATVYFSGAELAQNVSLNLPIGSSEIVIKNVANQINESTILVGVPKNITVLSTQFTTNYISEYEIDETNPLTKKVRDSIKYYQKENLKLNNEITTTSKTIELLDRNQQVYGANSGLNLLELSKMVDFYSAKRLALSNKINTLSEGVEKYNTRINLLNQKLTVSAEKEEKISTGKLVIQVMNEIAGVVNFDISYMTQLASWQPFYDLRANDAKSPIELVYKAKVQQNCGVDWKKVKLTLSSGNPNQSNIAPLFSSWYLKYGNPYARFQNARQDMRNSMRVAAEGAPAPSKSLNGELQGKAAGVQIRGISSLNDDEKQLYIVDGNPVSIEDYKSIPSESIKSVNVLKDATATSIYGSRAANGVIVVTTKDMNDYTSIEENQLNISFDIDIPYDVMSNGKDHSVALKEIKLPAKYKHYAAPKLDKEAFLIAELSDYSKYNLLPGEANIVFEGVYVGKTLINPNQTNEILNLSMGRDKKVSIKREKVADMSGTKFLSSFKEQTFTYDITIRNNKKEDVVLQLKDQIPLSTDEDIIITLLEDGKGDLNKDLGVLNWELNLKPNENKKIRISYMVKYPKSKTIENL